MNTQPDTQGATTDRPSILRGRFTTPDPTDGSIGFAVQGVGPLMALSALLPMIENLGVDVLTSHSESSGAGWQVELCLRPHAPTLLASQPMQNRFIDTLLAVGRGSIDNDGFNRLVTLGDFDLRACVLLRALARYLGQINLPFSSSYMEATLCAHPTIAAELVAYFIARFDPDAPRDSAALASQRAALLSQVDAVAALDEDRILRAYIEVIDALLRTNYFRAEIWSDPSRCLALKLQPQRISAMPKPVPAFEIFVFGPAVEGVHLRGGKVARGGLRWSERMEDYRTEVLGLVKAQMVKNAVIVPTGAKGGFICKQLQQTATAEARFEQVRAAYSSYIRALLELTDNRTATGIVPPPRVVRYDEDDSYLVVAADKGTATFSDTANAIALEAGFWLGDAFASGGSQGYDHKKMGITARGAWESTKRLFKELGHDSQNTPFRVVGIGDMGGDVFGNGMLLSQQIRLVAAFNHQHIFLDPNPDAARSFKERQRLFQLPRSSWLDYNPELISSGGGVFSRHAKRIVLTPEICIALGIAGQPTELPPNALIQAILAAPVELLWNGGIGTYVRASHERDAEVGDRANDALRIAANQLRTRVVVEGGNLGLTQAARVEFARRGGLINTDAVDNSAGVDCSDHEVNIKILLDQLVRAGEIDPAQRNQLLDAMTDEVAELVLRNNYQQGKMLSQSSRTAPAFAAKHAQLIQLLERQGRLDRQLEQLPDDAEIEARLTNQQGLTRPEIAVLLAYTKSRVFEKLVQADVIDDPTIAAELPRYFPTRLQQHYPDAIAQHPLRKEILAAQLTNQVMNRMGATFCLRLLEEEEVSCTRWIQSYTIAREALGIPALVRDIEALGFSVSNDVQMDLQLQIHLPLERATHWVLEHADWSHDTEALIAHYRAAVDHTRQHLQLPTDAPIAARVEALEELYYAFDIADLTDQSGRPLAQVAADYFALNQRLELFWLRRAVEQLPAFDKWQRKLKLALIKDIDRAIKGHLLALIGTAATPAVSDGAAQESAIAQYRELVNEARAQPSQHLAMLVYLTRSLTLLDLNPASHHRNRGAH